MNLNIRKTITLLCLLAVLIPISCLAILEEDEEVIKSFMPGVIRRIAVVPGQQIKRGDLLYVFEVMKMELSVTALNAGFIGALYLTVGQYIEKDMSLITILPFMPVEKGEDPMDVDELPLPVFEITASLTEAINNEGGISNLSSPESVIIPIEQFTSEAELIPEIFDSEENTSPKIVATLPVEQSVFENELQTTQQEEMLPLVVGPISEIFDNEVEGADVSLSVVDPQASQQEERLPLAAVPIIEIPKSEEGIFDVPPSAMITFVEQRVSENKPQTSHQEQILPLVVSPITEIFDNEGEGVVSLLSLIANDTKQSISEIITQTPQHEEILPLVVRPISETFDNEGDRADVSLSVVDSQASQQEETLSLIITSMTEALNDEVEKEAATSLPSVSASETKPSIFESEVEFQTPQQVSTPSWIASASTSPRDEEVEGEVVASLPFVIANEAKPSIFKLEKLPQAFQQKVTSFLNAALSSRPDLPFNLSEAKVFNDDETGISSSFQKVKEEELRQELNNPMVSFHLPWLTGLLLLGFIFFCRAKPIMSYRVKNILTHKGAVNLNIPGYLRDAA